ncbi:MAG: tyrosine-type recombinase/integrase [Limisphaerales bacterium]
MKSRYRTYRRASSQFCVLDSVTGKRESLRTSNPREAARLIQARNDAHDQPTFNLQLARMYLTGADPDGAKRTWRDVLTAVIELKHGPTRDRWGVAGRKKALAPLLRRPLVDTRPEHFLTAIKAGTVSTNIYLRRLQNFAVDMGWLPTPLLLKRQWPQPRFQSKRSITAAEHERILGAEKNPEWNVFYRFCWHLGGSQTDVASLLAEDVDWNIQTIAYRRRKTGTPVALRFGDELADLLRNHLPVQGPLFPRLAEPYEKHRAKLFNRRCRLLGIKGVSLHSYRYAWAERAMSCGYPERFAQAALGHNSKAVHRAYARHAEFTLPPLDEYERLATEHKVLPVGFRRTATATQNPTSAPIDPAPANGSCATG